MVVVVVMVVVGVLSGLTSSSDLAQTTSRTDLGSPCLIDIGPRGGGGPTEGDRGWGSARRSGAGGTRENTSWF